MEVDMKSSTIIILIIGLLSGWIAVGIVNSDDFTEVIYEEEYYENDYEEQIDRDDGILLDLDNILTHKS